MSLPTSMRLLILQSLHQCAISETHYMHLTLQLIHLLLADLAGGTTAFLRTEHKMARLTIGVGITIACLSVVIYRALPGQPKPSSAYIAAVVEFNPIGASSLTPNSKTVELNLKQYLEFVQDAKQKHADIVVFPEYGLTTIAPYNQRDLALTFSQRIASPSEKFNPCDMESGPDVRIIKALSCEAQRNKIYVAANILEKFVENAKNETLLYNTNVVFDRDGIIIARYRKFNLFAEVALNKTEEAEHSIFKTDFGKTFGLVTCFDMMFASPAVELVKKYKVNGIIFPTAWFSELPFLTAIQAQAAWSFGMKVDLLAANYNFPPSGSTGSGVYHTGRWGGKFNSMALLGEESSLLVTKVDPEIINSELKSYSCDFKTSEENLENYLVKPLLPSEDPRTETLCYDQFCCDVTYAFKGDETVHYQLLVFSGNRSHAKVHVSQMQVCGLVACSGPDKQSCAHHFSESPYSKVVTFNSLKIKANFSLSAVVLPNTLESNFCGPLRSEHYRFGYGNTLDNEYFMELVHKTPAVHTFALYSHGF